MPFAVDRTQAPLWLRYTVTGPWPSIDEQHDLRLELKASGDLTAETRGLFDLRQSENTPHFPVIQATIDRAVRDGSWPLRRAYLVLPGVQYGVVRQIIAIVPPGFEIEIFTDEAAALEWLLKK